MDSLKSLSFSKVILVLEKTEVTGCQIWAIRGLSQLDDLMFHQKTLHEWACCRDKAANHQLPIAVAFWIIQIVSVEKCSSFMQNLMQMHCSTHSVILNAMATQHTCSLNGVYHPHWLVQWSHHCPCMCIPVHSPWLPGYIDITQTILVILTMAGIFQTDLIFCLLFMVE